MLHRSRPVLIIIGSVLSLASARAGPAQCRDATFRYNEMVAAIHAAIQDYERWVTASLARDDCGAEFIELQLTYRDFEIAVTDRGAECGRAE